MKCFKYLLILSMIFTSSLLGNEKLVFGINPYKDPKELQEICGEFLSYLEKELGKEIIFVTSNDYLHLATLIEAGKIDFASVSPKLLSNIRQRIKGTQYLATIKIKDKRKISKSTYRGLIIVKNDGTMNQLADLKGKRFGFTDKESTSGYFYPRILLKEAGLSPEKDFASVFLLKKHPKVISALLENSIDAAAVDEDTYQNMIDEIENKLKIIAVTEEIPYDAIVASPHMPVEMSKKIKNLLLKFQSDTPIESGIVGFEEKSVWVYDRLSTLQ